jgi:tetratricopeptide (TPR) repeat protein
MKQPKYNDIALKTSRSLWGRARIDVCWWTIIGISCVYLSGCVGWGATNQAVKRNTANDAGPSREDRKKALAQEFDQQRDDAQLDAAASCWQRGDVDGCQKIIDKLLARNPNNRRALLLLADVDLFSGRTDQAAEQLQTLVAADPKDAVAQHALAQVWDAAGRHQEALEHYKIASELDPQNEEYALSYKMADGTMTVPELNLSEQNSANHQSAAMAASYHPNTAASSQPKTIIDGEVQLASTTVPIPALEPTAGKPAGAIPLGPVVHAANLPSAESRQTSNLKATTSSADSGLPQVNKPNAGVLETDLKSTEQSASRLHDDPTVQHATPTFAPPVKVNDWLGRLDFGAATSEEPTVTNSALSTAEKPAVRQVAFSEEASAPKIAGDGKPAVISAQSEISANSSESPLILHDPLHRAAAALAQGDTETALDIASRGLSQNPEEASALYRVLGTAHYRRGEYQAAQAALTQALSLDKSDALSYFLMGSTLEKLAQHEAAQGYFAEAARLDGRYAF